MAGQGEPVGRGSFAKPESGEPIDRHPPPTLTLTARYSHRRLYDLAGAVDKLPNLVPNSNTPNTEDEQIPLRMMGTDGAKFVPPAVPNLVQHRRIRLHIYAPMYTSATEEQGLEEV